MLAHKATTIVRVTLDLFLLLCVHVIVFVIKHGCFNDLGEVLCNGKMASLSCELCELVTLRTLRESSAINRITVLESSIGAR